MRWELACNSGRIQLDILKTEHKGGYLDTSSDSEIQAFR